MGIVTNLLKARRNNCLATNHYTIAVDAMGGDFGPEAAIPASLMALQEHKNLTIILVGDEITISQYLKAMLGKSEPRCQIHHASQRIEMDESPVVALRHKTDSSMRVALNLVQEGQADACVSAGNTGALVATARLVLKTLSGIDRPALSILLPTLRPNQTVRLLDLGANVDVSVDHLFQFAVMGLVLSQEVDQVPQPKLALLNVGKEPDKGNRLLREAGELFTKEADSLNYIGYIEGDELFNGNVDVVICDGFTGNIALKIIEGASKLLKENIKNIFTKSPFSQMTGLLAQPYLSKAAKQLNADYYNGASLIGLQGTVIKSHGSADARAFKYALERTMIEIDKQVIQRIATRVNSFLNQ
jgi:glycerol-3-phosphate acyltransferase PlsX